MKRPSTFTVTLIGADGAGKTTVTQRLLESLSRPCRYLYMGVSVASSNRMLPTTWLAYAWRKASGKAHDHQGPPDPDRPREPPRGALKRIAKGLRNTGHYLILISEEWYRQGLTWWHLRRGRIVLYDRHFFIDYYAYDITQPHTFWQRLHGAMLNRCYPQPQLVIFLDAPADLLFARKGEGSVELLERRRQDYLTLRNVLPNFMTLDASQPLDTVVEQAAAMIERFRP